MTNYIVTDLGFGDSGKGTVVDYLAHHSPRAVVIRHNGGAQAGHNVVREDGKHHCFSQFGAGAYQGASTYLSQYMLINPFNMQKEADHLRKHNTASFSKLHVAYNATIITPWHVRMNRIREQARGADAHGTVGQGIGETVSSAIAHPDRRLVAGVLGYPVVVRAKLMFWQRWFEEECNEIGVTPPADMLNPALIDQCCNFYQAVAGQWRVESDTLIQDGTIANPLIFEGAQGVLLDEVHGFYPHMTWSDCTPGNAERLLHGQYAVKIGVLRSYMTRHGAGPFPTEWEDGPVLDTLLPEPYNPHTGMQGVFRRGALDIPLLKYAIKACGGVDALAVTHLDRVTDGWEVCTSYKGDEPEPHFDPATLGTAWAARTKLVQDAFPRMETWDRADFLDRLEMELQVPVLIESHGPTWRDKKMR